jgi:tRNA dimethylallyltransferase
VVENSSSECIKLPWPGKRAATVTLMDELPIVCLTGTTGSGKTAVSVELARALAVEVVCADSRTLYGELSVGATKATEAERAACPHHLLDVLRLEETWTLDDFRAAAEQAIAEISARGALPLVVGGTRLYVEALCFELERARLGAAEWAALADAPAYRLRQLYRESETSLPLWWRSREALLRVLDANRISGLGRPSRNALLLAVGPFTPKEIETRIRARAGEIISAGSETEVAAICQRHGCLADDLNSVCYKEWQAVWDGEETRAEALETMINHTLYHVARQQRWLESLPGLHWVRSADEALALISKWRSV